MARLGDACPKCPGGTYKVLNTRVVAGEEYRVRWIGCGACGYRPPENKQIVPLEFAPRRLAGMRRLSLRRR